MHLGGQYAVTVHPGTRRTGRSDAGYAMAALIAAIAVMGIFWSMAIPVWRHAAQREKEAELIFRAGQYARAIALYQRRYANAFPPNIDVLLKEKFLRKKYLDPITGGEFRVLSPLELQTLGGGVVTSTRPGLPPTGSGTAPSPGGPGSTEDKDTSSRGSAFQNPPLNMPGTPASRQVTAGVGAVVSRSTARSIRVFKNRQQYNQWIVTVEDVMPRRGLQPPQPGQPGLPGGAGAPRPGVPSVPGGGQPTGQPSGPR
ncbi:MAG TPA: hypothetical protein VIL35_16065 [Vicinamibacterales bacterium]